MKTRSQAKAPIVEVCETPELVAQILSHVPARTRLAICSRLNRTWAKCEKDVLAGALCEEETTTVDVDSISVIDAGQLSDLMRKGYVPFKQGKLEQLLGFYVSLSIHDYPPRKFGLNDHFLKRLPIFSNLRSLDLLDCHRITDEGMASIASLDIFSLELMVTNVWITNKGIKALEPLGDSLTSLVLCGGDGWGRCFMDDETLALIGEQFPLLDWLNTYGIGCGRVIEAADEDGEFYELWQEWHGGFRHLRALEYLEYFSLCEGMVNDNALSHVCWMASLTALDLSYYSKITDKGLSHLASLHNLEALDLSSPASYTTENLVTDRGIGYLLPLAERHSLTILCLKGNNAVTEPPGPNASRFIELGIDIRSSEQWSAHIA